MGRILEYVVLLSNLSLILALQQSHGNYNERRKQENLTHVIKPFFPKEQNDFFNKKALPLEFQGRRRPLSSGSKQMRSSIGLHAFASDNLEWRSRKRNSSHSNQGRRNVAPPFSQALYPRKNSKNSWTSDYRGNQPSIRLSKVYNPNNSLNYQSKRPHENERKYKEGRNARYHPRHSAKICDSCNSVPWIPVIKVSESYRQQRTHVTELHPTPQQNLNFDYHSFASNTHNVLLPAVPLVPPVEPVYDGTISSSFGLPIGNIPTSHGLLAPINHAANTIDYSSSFNYFAPQGLLESHPFPELSQVPIVPIHDSGQFYQFDSQTPDLVPPPSKPVDVSNVVLTISEEQSAKQEPPKPEPLKPEIHNHNHNHNHYQNHNQNLNQNHNQNFNQNHNQNLNQNHNQNPNQKPYVDLSSDSTAVDSQASRPQHKEKNQKDFGRLEIVKSIPLAEFTSSHQQELPLYPPLQSESSTYDSQKSSTQTSVTHYPDLNYNFLVPPVKPELNFTSYSNNSVLSVSKSFDKLELEGQSSVPRPLTSPSLSWLFADHTAPPGDSKSTASVSSFATEAHEIASVVNNELRPVSPLPYSASSPTEQNVGNSKNKKIQIIIPYTTKNKNEHDNNALESVQHEVFQHPSKSTSENNFYDFATSALPPLTRPSETISEHTKEYTTENQQTGEEKSHRYLKEMHHIIASNLRELLKEEIEKTQTDQNYPLQNNIDNWTALEYSNHKTVEPKAPKEIITQALAVTSIPGTSISHLLLPSKKIPNEYFVTTPLPVYDEPSSAAYKAANSTVNSSPFTAKPYATTNIYTTKSLKENEKQSTPGSQINHEKNYTEIVRGKVNNWGRLNENLVLPEARSKTRRVEQTTSGWTSSLFATSGKEKVQIVTPISLTNQRNYTTTSFRRTTRQIHQIVTSTTQKPLFLNRLNSTKLEKVSNQSSPFNRKFSYNSTTTQPVTVLRVETTNNTVTVEGSSVKTNETISRKNVTSEEKVLSSNSEHLSINDIFPFRNKELPWESNLNSSQVLPVGRQRKSLIKQANLQRSKVVVLPS